MDATSSGSWWARHELVLRRLHSLSGLVPVGAYMVVHLITNASVLAGAGTFQNQVDTIHSLGPALPLVEWTFIFLPIIFHTVLGVWIIRQCKPNAGSYGFVNNVRYTLQRATAWIALFFIAWHVFHMHGWIHSDLWLERVAHPAFGAQFDPHHATSSAAAALAPMLVKVLYAVGVIACVYHFANGIWTMGITWGAWTTAAAQRRANWIAVLVGVPVAIVGILALVGMSTVDRAEALAIEQVRIEQHEQQLERERELADELRAAEANQPDAAQDDSASAGDNPEGR